MQFISSAQMRTLDEQTIQEIGLPAAVLIENAGRAIAAEVVRFCLDQKVHKVNRGGQGRLQRRIWDEYPNGVSNPNSLELEHWLVLVGKGNNGADGIAAARYLVDSGLCVTLLYATSEQEMSIETLAQAAIAQKLGIPSKLYGRDDLAYGQFTGIIDALLGTGSRGNPRGNVAEMIDQANLTGLPIMCADIPSGVDADTGALYHPCIQARVTLCLGVLKAGLTQYPGAHAAGTVVVRSIGIPAKLAANVKPAGFVLTDEILERELGVDPARLRDSDGHKGTYGHVLVAAGSSTMSGAGLLASKAALRAGCGLATWALPEALAPHVAGAVPELMLAPVGGSMGWGAAAAHEVLRLLETRDVLAVGPGLGRFEEEGAFLRALWEGAPRPLVVDADALNILAAAGGLAAWKRRESATILTPHPGEMARLAGVSTAEVQRDRLGLARAFALEHGITLVLKGSRTVVAAPDGRIFVNTTGTPGMATGGAGDVLTGIIAGQLAQGLSAEQAAAFGVHLHGLAGERAAALRNSPASLLAGDIIEQL
ncbi:NAD(P)H-hydrate dehydratase [Paenibacillus shirakamiensis]|uniref:NAD(P)H-hydrate dehydratase n=1 Tax=Paenibacillus shirakamiensis TaxID=1265935 RepID=UPI001AE7DE36|nr:NAD(P)H-hydrate dehydratase [Paenibacillus shirakamiensis]